MISAPNQKTTTFETVMEGGLLSIDIRDMDFSYGEFPILKEINLHLDKPELVSILGPNGVGKSTLIRCLDKMLTPQKGTIEVCGRNLKDVTIKELAKIMGYVPCSSSTTFPITVVDAVMMGRYPHQKYGSLNYDLDVVYETLDVLGISDLSMRQLNELSAGQHQKVMLAKGLAQDPKILLLDEPTANLDVKHQLNVTRMLRDISHEKGVLVVMICHDINIAAKYSDRIVLMHEGTIYKTGSVADVITEENLQKVYGVESKIIDDLGRPHALLRDDEEVRSAFS